LQCQTLYFDLKIWHKNKNIAAKTKFKL